MLCRLEVADSRKDNGAPVQQWDCAGVTTQEWELQGTPDSRILKNANSGKVLEIDNSHTVNGARVQQWDNVGQPSGKWRESWPKAPHSTEQPYGAGPH
ncbi:RICIN domain-containing protein, partial [Streptomyces violascens]|uniref:RICIN domain-containing protein n=1 Tax=Streptomyces violascens TaxID=67381 RepID=UPI00365E5F0D